MNGFCNVFLILLECVYKKILGELSDKQIFLFCLLFFEKSSERREIFFFLIYYKVFLGWSEKHGTHFFSNSVELESEKVCLCVSFIFVCLFFTVKIN